MFVITGREQPRDIVHYDDALAAFQCNVERKRKLRQRRQLGYLSLVVGNEGLKGVVLLSPERFEISNLCSRRRMLFSGTSRFGAVREQNIKDHATPVCCKSVVTT